MRLNQKESTEQGLAQDTKQLPVLPEPQNAKKYDWKSEN